MGSSDNQNHRFLSLTGVIIDLDYVLTTIYPEIKQLKNKYFKHHPDEPIIFHRKEIINMRPPFHVLKDENIKNDFNKDLLCLLGKWDYTVITVCIDKKRHKDTYHVWRYDPYHYCLAMMLERYCLYLERKKEKGDVMAESRGGKADMRLKKSFKNIYEKGTEFIESSRFHNVFTSKELKVKPKINNISGLQLADLIAHPSRNEILLEQSLISELAPFCKKIVKILQNKYDRNDKIIYGKKFI